MTLNFDIALVVADDTVTYSQPQPGTTGFSGKKRLKDFIYMILSNTASGIGNLNFQIALQCFGARFNDDITVFADGMYGIEKNIDHDLFNLVSIQENRN